jgi:propanol-preferring alcohol dehydrogenase
MVRHRFPNSKVYVFSRNAVEREFALGPGAAWARDTADETPEKLDAIIDTSPVWKPVIEALKDLSPGGRLVVNAIRKEEVDKETLLRLRGVAIRPFHTRAYAGPVPATRWHNCTSAT